MRGRVIVVGLCACVRACVCLSVSVCEQVFSRAVSAVGTERGGMDKHHGRSVQQETGAALTTERRFPAASYSLGRALIRDRDCSSIRLRETAVNISSLEKQWWQ